MDSIDPQTQLWITVAGAAAAGILALLGSVLGNYLTHSSEHARWKRDKRYEIYLKCLNPIVDVEKKLMSYSKDGYGLFDELPTPSISDYPMGEMQIWMSKKAKDAGLTAYLGYLTALSRVMDHDPERLAKPLSIPLLDEYKDEFVKQLKKDLRIR